MLLWWDGMTEFTLIHLLKSVHSTVAMHGVTHLDSENLPLTYFRQCWQLLGRYCSYLLPRQDGGKFQIQINGRLLPRRRVTL